MAKSVYQILIELDGAQNVKGSLQEIGTEIGLTGAALTAFSAGAAKLAGDYEKALKDVSTVSDETTGTTEEYSRALIQLQKDLDGALNIQEAATASYDIASAGIKDQEALLSALSQSQKAAIAGQSDLNSISSAAVSVLNSYGDSLGEGLTEAEKFEKVINLLIQTQLDGVIKGSEYAASIGNIASTAAGANIPIEELNAAIAQSTSKGTPAAQAFTRLTALISNIQKPTAEAVEEANRLGIAFDAQALEAGGLIGVITDLANSGNLNAESFSKLFGSTEALGIAQQLAANGASEFQDKLDSQLSSVTALDDAYAQTGDTLNQRVTNNINKLQTSLIQLGQGVIIAAEPFIALLSNTLDLLGQLDPNVLKVLGSITLVGGAVATLTGALSLLIITAASTATALTTLKASFIATKVATAATTAAQIAYNLAVKQLTLSQLISALGTKVVALKSTTLALGSAKAAMISFSASAKAALIAAGPLIALFAALGASVELLRRDLKNREIEEFNQNLINLRKQSEPLQRTAEGLAQRIRETGEAIPDEEFQKYIDLFEEADGGSGVLKGTIEALTRVQNKAKEETKEGTKATEEAGQSIEEYAEKVSSAISDIERQAEIQKELNNALAGSEEQALTQNLAVDEESIGEQIALLEDLKNQEGLSAEERKDIELDVQEKKVELQKSRIETAEQLEQKYNQFLRDANTLRQTELERSILENNLTIQQSYEDRKALIQETSSTRRTTQTQLQRSMDSISILGETQTVDLVITMQTMGFLGHE